MTKTVAITCRVVENTRYPERRDALDQQWYKLFARLGLLPLILPNHLALAQALLEQVPVAGLVLSGGNSPLAYGGDAPERDAVDEFLIQWAQKHDRPLLGVCRGMQSLQMAFGQTLTEVQGHVQAKQQIWVQGQPLELNAYHNWGCFDSVSALEVWAHSDDGVVKAVKHHSAKLWGIMWHPERLQPFHPHDLQFFQDLFK